MFNIVLPGRLLFFILSKYEQTKLLKKCIDNCKLSQFDDEVKCNAKIRNLENLCGYWKGSV